MLSFTTAVRVSPMNGTKLSMQPRTNNCDSWGKVEENGPEYHKDVARQTTQNLDAAWPGALKTKDTAGQRNILTNILCMITAETLGAAINKPEQNYHTIKQKTKTKKKNQR